MHAWGLTGLQAVKRRLLEGVDFEWVFACRRAVFARRRLAGALHAGRPGHLMRAGLVIKLHKVCAGWKSRYAIVRALCFDCLRCIDGHVWSFALCIHGIYCV